MASDVGKGVDRGGGERVEFVGERNGGTDVGVARGPDAGAKGGGGMVERRGEEARGRHGEAAGWVERRSSERGRVERRAVGERSKENSGERAEVGRAALEREWLGGGVPGAGAERFAVRIPEPAGASGPRGGILTGGVSLRRLVGDQPGGGALLDLPWAMDGKGLWVTPGGVKGD